MAEGIPPGDWPEKVRVSDHYDEAIEVRKFWMMAGLRLLDVDPVLANMLGVSCEFISLTPPRYTVYPDEDEKGQ